MNTTDYSATGAQRVAAGIWPWKCKDSVFQYNECYNNLNSFNGNGDGQAWDADWTDGTVLPVQLQPRKFRRCDHVLW